MRKNTNGQAVTSRKRKYGWRHLLRERSWTVVSVIVGITTMANVSSLGALIVPSTAGATTTPSICTTNFSPTTNAVVGGATSDVENPTYAYSQNNTDAKFDADDHHLFGGFGITLPVGTTATGIEVTVRGHRTSGSGNKPMTVYLSENGGANWPGSIYDISFDSSSYDTDAVGGSSDMWNRASWTANELADGNFVVRLSNDYSSGVVGIDHVKVKVCYQLQEGTIKVNKKVDADGNGSFEGGNTTSNNLGFRWGYDANSANRSMGTSATMTVGSHTVTENTVAGYHFVGWYPTGSNDFSCGRPKGTELPVDVTVTNNHTTEITLCNAKDEDEPVTINAWKVVCSNETDLPNWGKFGGPNVTAVTAQNWVNSHQSCSLSSDWSFEWAPDYPGNPGDNTGAAGSPWTTFGPTDGNGFTTASIPDLDGMTKLWVREVWQDGFIPFTYGEHNNNENPVSAEMYCHTDVINYDNFDYINHLEQGATYTCVAWNVQDHGTVTVTKKLDNDTDGTFELTNPLGWSWQIDQTTGLMMGTSTTATPGQHTIIEHGPSEGYHFVGWFYSNTDYSCEQLPENEVNHLHPITVNVTSGQNAAITICNQKDEDLRQPDLSITKTVDKATANPGETLTYTITVINNGPVPATGVRVDDTLPAGVSAPFELSNESATLGEGHLVWNNLTVGANSTLVITFKVTVNAELPVGTTVITNTVDLSNSPVLQSVGLFSLSSVSAMAVSAPVYSGHATAVTTVATSVNATLDKQGPVSATPGQSFSYTLAWSVSGNTNATNAVITDPLPSNTTFVSADNGGTFAAGVVTWNLGTKAPGSNGTVSVTVLVSANLSASTTLVNTGTFDTNQTTPVNDTVSTSVTVPQVLGVSTELGLTKSVDQLIAAPGETVTYTLVVTNDGLGEATNVVVTDNLPDGFVFLATNKTTRSWNLGTLAAGESKTLIYKAVIGQDVAAGQYVNRAFVTADFLDPIVSEAMVTVKVPQVLGLATTGAGLMDYLAFTAGLILVAAGVVSFRQLRRRGSVSA